MATCLLDTNIALRLMDTNAAEHHACRDKVRHLSEEGHLLLLAPQTVYEFWVVATRPFDKNGFGWPTHKTAAALDQLFLAFPVYPDPPELFNSWRKLVQERSISGKRAHDARLAVFKNIHQIRYFLTINDSDFVNLTDGVISPIVDKKDQL